MNIYNDKDYYINMEELKEQNFILKIKLKELEEKYDKVCEENKKLKRMYYGSKLRRKY